MNVSHQLIDGMLDISNVAVHRDIKLQNILISNGMYKISDYGLAKYAGATTRATSQTMKNMGSVPYYAPELWAQPDSHGLNDVQVDIYAMGIVSPAHLPAGTAGCCSGAFCPDTCPAKCFPDGPGSASSSV